MGYMCLQTIFEGGERGGADMNQKKNKKKRGSNAHEEGMCEGKHMFM